MYEDPFPHPALRGGGEGGVFPRLLSFVVRAMAIAQLTQLKISIPESGAPPGQVPADCFPGGTPSQKLTSSRHVSFSSSGVQELLRSAVAEEDEMDTVGRGTTDTMDTPPTIIPPPPGFSQFSWTYQDWSVGDELCLFMFTKELPGWLPWHSGACQLICHRCRCRRSYPIVPTIQ